MAILRSKCWERKTIYIAALCVLHFSHNSSFVLDLECNYKALWYFTNVQKWAYACTRNGCCTRAKWNPPQTADRGSVRVPSNPVLVRQRGILLPLGPWIFIFPHSSLKWQKHKQSQWKRCIFMCPNKKQTCYLAY